MADKIITLTKEPAPVSNVTRLIEDDNKTYTIQFVIKRYWGGVDLSTLMWSVNLKTASNEKYYSSITIVHYDDDNVYLSWNVGVVATVVRGKTFYTIEGRSTTTQTDPPVWRSSIQEIDVGAAISAEDIFTPGDISAIEALIIELRGVVEDEAGNIVIVSETQPLSEYNKIWFNPSAQEYVVPTMDDVEGCVRADAVQDFTEEEKLQARVNIGANIIISDTKLIIS